MEDLDLEAENLSEIYNYSLMIQIAAAGVASSFVLILIPNVETISLMSFFLGYRFRGKFAIQTTLLMVFTWEILATMVFSTSGIIFPFKVIAWLVISLLGRMTYKMGITSPIILGLLGILSAAIFDILVTIPFAFIGVSSFLGFFSVFVTGLLVGLYFTILHMISNGLLFSIIPLIITNTNSLLQTNHADLLQNEFDPRKAKTTRRVTIIMSISLIVLLIFTLNYNPTPLVHEPEVVDVEMIVSFNGVQENFTKDILTLNNFTVFDILNTSTNLDYRFYGSAVYVFGINGIIENEDMQNHYWIYYVNGDRANTASNFYSLQGVETIVWNYEG